MKVPHADEAIVPSAKLVDYLLSSSHPIGRYKASFFARLGFTQDNSAEFEAALRALLRLDVVSEGSTEFGRKYVASGQITGPNGQSGEIVAVWIILTGQRAPRLVTAYPGEWS